MKKYITILSITISCVLFTSCDDYLNENPDDRQEVKTLENIQELLVSGYSEASYNFIEWQTDNVVAIPDNTQFPEMTETFQFIPVVSSEQQDTPTYFWTLTYTAIAHANQALEEMSKITISNKDIVKADAIKGEAYLVRAYNHFLLANIFCQTYDETTAGTNLGVPYILAPETNLLVSYERGTLKETYDKIEDDLEKGLVLLNNDFYKGSGKYHFNLNAAYAFASRFYLYKSDYENCIKYSNKILGNNTATTTYIKDMDAVFKGTSLAGISAQFIDVNSPTNFLVVRKESTYVRANRGYRSNSSIFAQLYTNNIQGGVDNRDLRYQYGGTESRYQPKYAELFRYTTSTTGFPYYIQPELRSEETIFNRMESFVKRGNISQALADYNVFAKLRYENGGQLTLNKITDYYSDAATEEEAMMAFIISERRKEFLGEGLRWWDIKRFNIAVTHVDVTGQTFTLEKVDPKKAVQIPLGAIASGIEANPR
ncbi:hypothetical protein HNQ02_002136 [Flavobacterium sp. 7E]|uniref:RagB/SusD family nutrient uptake outer membrane protein n=1 Tax=Flavobacterium sp. 7E TaxID=2735898 RepID=UPI001570716A|nr:RagB/SusD family nutrient uptake outer membrane protein [Flavobacterium sp. 7E]NRS89214.1 hypothetical protein [Flavobacterium sp. 7E]